MARRKQKLRSPVRASLRRFRTDRACQPKQKDGLAPFYGSVSPKENSPFLFSFCSNRDRIGQAAARTRHSSKKVSVFVEPDVVSTGCLLTFRPIGILSTRLILVLPRHPQKCNVILCSTGSSGASNLTGRARQALPGPTLLRTRRRTLAAVPDLARSASLRNGSWFC
jgi:hypothetical protein